MRVSHCSSTQGVNREVVGQVMQALYNKVKDSCRLETEVGKIIKNVI